ncbi:MAG: thioredoxin [Clostridiales bacterium]|jgi:thioredoxin 1|nr:thioredoxin [Clostridiales bacterium]
MNTFIIEGTEKNFDEITAQKDKPVLVDFWAEWCGPCRMLSPIIDKVAEKMNDKAVVCKVNIDENPNIASKFGIMSIPTLIVFKDGEVVEQETGARPESAIVQLIEAHL